MISMRTFVPAKVIQSRLHKHVFMTFAEKVGLVYFGYVNQRSDDHRLVRGLTVSANHRDNHYCIGTFKTYDITVVERTDTVSFPGKPNKNHDWIIMAIDLHTQRDLPHVFLGLHSYSEAFYAQLFTKFTHFIKLPSGQYDPAFIHRYDIYSQPDKMLETQQLFTQHTTQLIAEYFGGLMIELAENCLYVYAEHRPTEALLERMLQYGVWLAQSIDQANLI